MGALEVLGKDVPCVHRVDEALDLGGHVRLRHPLEVGQHLRQAVIELILQLIHLGPAVHAVG